MFKHNISSAAYQPGLAIAQGLEDGYGTTLRCDFSLSGGLELLALEQESACLTTDKISDCYPSGCCEELDHQDQYGFTPLHYAAMGGFIEIAVILLQRGAGRSVTNSQGQTALHLAVENGHQDVVKLLLQL
jgi:hypothetical protein